MAGAGAGDRVLAGYQLAERLAVGGMAEIFRAVRQGPGDFAKTVAIKMVLPDLGRDPQFVEMFLDEARLAARLGSPHLVQVFDFGEQEGTYFLVMEYLDGGDLAALLAQSGALEVDLAIFIARQLCAALVDLHGAVDDRGEPLNIVHRDVNPGNVLLSRAGDLKLGDFGIAKARARAVRTERGAIKGKLAYLSPEQVRGEEVDQRSDLYGVGLVLFEALVGQRYLIGDDEATLLRAAEQPTFRKPSSLRPELPTQIDDLLARALAVEPANRFPDVRLFDSALAKVTSGDRANLRRKLAALAAGMPSTATPATRPQGQQAAAVVKDKPLTEVLAQPPPTRKRGIAVGGALLVVGALLAAWLLSREEKTKPTVAPSTAIVRDVSAKVSAADLGADIVAVSDVVSDLIQPPDLSKPDRIVVRANDPSARRPKNRKPNRGSSGRRTPPDSATPARSADAAIAPTQNRANEHLAAVDRELRRKGILEADAPTLLERRRQLQGSTNEAAALQLLARARKLRVDRAFIEAKLRRLDRRIAAQKSNEGAKQRLRQRAARALSYAVTGRYADANRELNAIARAIH